MESFSFTEAAPFKLYTVFMKRPCRMTPQRLLKRINGTVQNMRSALDSAQSLCTQVSGGAAGTSKIEETKMHAG